MIFTFYGGSLVERAGASGVGVAWTRYGASTYTAPVVVPVVEDARRAVGGGGRRDLDEEAELLDEEAAIVAVVTWTIHHA